MALEKKGSELLVKMLSTNHQHQLIPSSTRGGWNAAIFIICKSPSVAWVVRG
jgi:hypothetical protein